METMAKSGVAQVAVIEGVTVSVEPSTTESPACRVVPLAATVKVVVNYMSLAKYHFDMPPV